MRFNWLFLFLLPVAAMANLSSADAKTLDILKKSSVHLLCDAETKPLLKETDVTIPVFAYLNWSGKWKNCYNISCSSCIFDDPATDIPYRTKDFLSTKDGTSQTKMPAINCKYYPFDHTTAAYAKPIDSPCITDNTCLPQGGDITGEFCGQGKPFSTDSTCLAVDTSTNQCVLVSEGGMCDIDSNCSTQKCSNKKCTSTCSSDSGCKQNETCLAGACRAQCSHSSDCEIGNVCVKNACASYRMIPDTTSSTAKKCGNCFYGGPCDPTTNKFCYTTQPGEDYVSARIYHTNIQNGATLSRDLLTEIHSNAYVCDAAEKRWLPNVTPATSYGDCIPGFKCDAKKKPTCLTPKNLLHCISNTWQADSTNYTTYSTCKWHDPCTGSGICHSIDNVYASGGTLSNVYACSGGKWVLHNKFDTCNNDKIGQTYFSNDCWDGSPCFVNDEVCYSQNMSVKDKYGWQNNVFKCTSGTWSSLVLVDDPNYKGSLCTADMPCKTENRICWDQSSDTQQCIINPMYHVGAKSTAFKCKRDKNNNLTWKLHCGRD